MNLISFFRLACIVFSSVCVTAVSVALGQPSTPTPVPQAEIVMNGNLFKQGEQLQATFRLNQSVTRAFTAYAVLILPGGAMMNAATLDTPLAPVASNVPRLDAVFTYPLINGAIPSGAPLGNYEVLAAFFDPAAPIGGREDAFLLASGLFKVNVEIPDISGHWSGTWVVTNPPSCTNVDGTWSADVVMAPDGQVTGHFTTDGDAEIEGDVAGTYDGTTATWRVSDPHLGIVTYSGQITAGGTTVTGTFWDGPVCSATRTSGTFQGGKE